MSEALNTKKKQGEILEILEAHDDHVAYESMGGDGRFHLTSESIFNDQEHTDLPPDKVDSDFECHEMYVHLKGTISEIPTYNFDNFFHFHF